MLHLSLFISHLILTCSSLFVEQLAIRGVYLIHVLYNPSYLNQSSFMVVNIKDQDIYMVAVYEGIVTNVICRETQSNQIITAPKGCDSNNENTALLRTNCGQKSVSGLEEFWTYSQNSAKCIQGGPDATCIGPPILASNGLPDDENDEFALMQGVYVVSGVGPQCSIPAVTKMHVEMPKLLVQSTCFPSGEYQTNLRVTQLKTFVFIKDLHSIHLTRTFFTHFELLVTFLNSTVLQSAEFYLTNLTNITGCVVQMDLIKAPRPLVLLKPVTRTASNYFKVIDTDEFYKTRTCNLGVGRKIFDSGLSSIQGVPEGVPVGGIPILITKHGLPIRFEADKRFEDYDFDCVRFYPKNDVFNGFGFGGFDGPEYSRSEPSRLSCFAPFPFVENILIVNTLEERAKQCKMLGGYSTSDVCVMDSWVQYCKSGWIFFDERCWYKFDSEQQSTLKVTIGSESDRVCKSLHPNALVATSISLFISAWLQRFFVFFKDPKTITRVVVSGRRCECYSSDGVDSCHCNELFFPLCYYHIKDVDIPFSSIAFHPKTISIFQHGQDGLPPDDSEIKCECFAGSGGSACATRTCVAPHVAALTINESISNPLVAFFKRCFAFNRGSCQDGNVDECVCKKGYGPIGNLYLEQNIDYPCACPSLATPKLSLIQINSNEPMEESLAVCGSIEQGRCITFGWNDAKCICNTRKTINLHTELAFNGKACSCPIPHYQKGEAVIETMCNSHGTCCPHEERSDGSRGSECTGTIDGCVCDNGYVGSSCTGRIPYKIPEESLVFPIGQSYAILTFEFKTRVKKVYTKGLSIIAVQLSNLGVLTPCVSTESEPWEVRYGNRWNCSGVLSSSLKILTATPPSSLFVEAFEDDFPPGGVFVNRFAARFFSTPLFRSKLEWVEEPDYVYSIYGVVNSQTVCLPAYPGDTCTVGVSAYHMDFSTGERIARVCGESTQPKRGYQNENSCECSTIGDGIAFQGDACECATVDGLLCANVGKCIKPSFPLGFCASDISRHHQDSLRYPWQQKEETIQKYILVQNALLMDMTIASGTEVFINHVQGPISFCSGNAMLDMSFSFGFFPQTQTFESCLYANPVSPFLTKQSKYGLTDCSNPIVRILLDTLLENPCSNEPISRFHNTLGLGYGLFWNLTRGIDFSKQPWGIPHYSLLSSLIGGRCGGFSEKNWLDRWQPSFESNLIPVFNSSSLLPNHRVISVYSPTPVMGIIIRDVNGRICSQRLEMTRGPVFCVGSFQFLNATSLSGVLISPLIYTLVPNSNFEWIDSIYQNMVNSFTLPMTNPCNDSTLNPEDDKDRTYMRDVFNTQIAPRICSRDSQCTQFEQSVCVAKAQTSRSWLNGDKIDDNAFGDEGGCDCTARGSFYSDATFCSTCKNGYGPNTPYDFASMGLFNDRISNLTTWIEGNISNVQRCSIPFDSTTTRVSAICGGRGYPKKINITVETRHVPVYTDQFETYSIRRCQSLIYNNISYNLNLDDRIHADILTYISENKSMLTVIYNRVFDVGNEVNVECIPMFRTPFQLFHHSQELVVLSARSLFSWTIPFISRTLSPTIQPTSKPSQSPSLPTTQTPSISPSPKPSKLPSKLPTYSPSKTPSITPSKVPTSPTLLPTKSPTVSPSISPSKIPTSPTILPTKSPTNPSLSPTKTPSKSPTFAPSCMPVSLCVFQNQPCCGGVCVEIFGFGFSCFATGGPTFQPT